MLSSTGVACVAFVTGSLAFWTPTYVYKSSLAGNGQADITKYHHLLFFEQGC